MIGVMTLYDPGFISPITVSNAGHRSITEGIAEGQKEGSGGGLGEVSS